MAEILDMHRRHAGLDVPLCEYLMEVANYIVTHYTGVNFFVGSAEPPASTEVEPELIAFSNMDPHQQASAAACLLYEYPKDGETAELQAFDSAVRRIMRDGEQDSMPPQYE